jgi:N6-adenosine-specific RNA methylase IME4
MSGNRETRYRTIVADPPWDVKAGPRSLHDPRERSRNLTYPTMTVAQIATLDVSGFADKDAHLYLWTINAYIEDAYEIARLWGFRPSTLLVWCKSPKGRGLGGTFPTFTEYILFARRGSLAATDRAATNWWKWERSFHSQKPEAFLDIVESVSPGPYLEMFARRNRLGWDTWGNEALEHVSVAAR